MDWVPPVIRQNLRMPRNLASKRGLQLSILIVGIIACWPDDWHAVAFRSPDLSPSQKVALRFPNLSPSQNVTLRFPELSPALDAAVFHPELWPSRIVAARFPEASVLGKPLPGRATTAVALASPKSPVHLIDFQVAATLPPIGHSRFCLRYPDDCKVHTIDFRRRNLVLTPERWDELKTVNRQVNGSIFAEATPGNGVTEEWVISPSTGDCKDYAVTKRHELLARGWPSRALLLSEVVLASGDHHLVLVVRLKEADLVLDNLHDDIRLVAQTYGRYHWMRIQSPENPKFWMSVRRQDAVRTAMLSN